MAFRFIHAADVHLDSPLLSLEEYPGAPVEEIRLATRKALANLVNLAIEEGAAFVIIAGDLFDGEWRDCNTGLHFVAEMRRLRAAGIRAYVALGNHDAANRMTIALPWGDNVHFFDHRRPERVPIPGCDVVLFGQSFRSPHVSDDLTATFPLGDPGAFNIGVLHTSVAGAPGHEPYAPCSLDGLLSRRYQYWALGHVHTRAELNPNPWVVFPGNIQGRSVRECGPRGCYLVDVDDRGDVTLRFEALDTVRWQVLRIHLDDSTPVEDLERIVEREITRAAADADERTLALRLVFEGHGPAWNSAAADLVTTTARLRALGQHMAVPVHVEKLQLAPQEPEQQAEASEPGPAGELHALVREFSQDPALMSGLQEEFEDLRVKLSAAVRLGETCPDPQDEAVLRNALASVEPLLAERERAKAKGAGR